MTNPIRKYFENIFAKKRIIGDDTSLEGLLKVDVLFYKLVTENKVPGLAITVLHEGEAIFQKGYGFADLENKVTIDAKKTLFRIASVSKPIAATALAKMVSEGLIDLDASFYKYVPYYPRKKWDFTIRQLAGHTAGIRGYRGLEYGLNKPYSIKESVELFKDDDLLFEPGTDYCYNSFDWVLISLAMQEASGVAFEKYVQENVLDPFGMENTFAEGHPERGRGTRNTFDEEIVFPHDLTNRITKFYSKNRLGFRIAIPVNNYYKLAGGGYLSTTADIAHFGQTYLNDEVLTKEMQGSFLSSEIVNGSKTYYGLGWQVSEDKKGRSFYGHVGNGVGGYSNFFVYPEQQMVFSILINCTNPDVQNELDEIIDILLNLHESSIL